LQKEKDSIISPEMINYWLETYQLKKKLRFNVDEVKDVNEVWVSLPSSSTLVRWSAMLVVEDILPYICWSHILYARFSRGPKVDSQLAGCEQGVVPHAIFPVQLATPGHFISTFTIVG
jgi:hypothetical protein